MPPDPETSCRTANMSGFIRLCRMGARARCPPPHPGAETAALTAKSFTTTGGFAQDKNPSSPGGPAQMITRITNLKPKNPHSFRRLFYSALFSPAIDNILFAPLVSDQYDGTLHSLKEIGISFLSLNALNYSFSIFAFAISAVILLYMNVKTTFWVVLLIYLIIFALGLCIEEGSLDYFIFGCIAGFPIALTFCLINRTPWRWTSRAATPTD